MLPFEFFAFAVLLVLAYGIQGALQAGYIRKYDALTVGIYRNVSLIVTMLPVLFLVPYSETVTILNHLPLLIVASGAGALGLWGSFSAAHYLPIGVGTALRQMSNVLTAIFLGVALFGEFLSPWQLLLLGGMLASGIALILIRVDYGHLNPKLVGKGIVRTLVAGVIVAISFSLLSKLSREVHPIAAAYFWEGSVGLWLYAMYLIRNRLYGTKLAAISRVDARSIVAISLLTILGTVGYASAVTYGPYAITSGFMSLTTLVAVLMGKVLYKEHLSRMQIVLILAAVSCIVLLKVA